MKTFLLVTLFSGALTLAPARADIPVPKTGVLIVDNLSAFPKYKFSIALEGEDQPRQPLEGGKIYSISRAAWLFVQEGNGKHYLWTRVDMPLQNWGAGFVKIRVKAVHPTSHGIDVSFDKTNDAGPPPKKSAARLLDLWPHFLLAGLGCCGLVFLARRKAAL